jgi:hypothetical protein
MDSPRFPLTETVSVAAVSKKLFIIAGSANVRRLKEWQEYKVALRW